MDLLTRVKELESKNVRDKLRPQDKRPRHYAEEILLLKTKEERKIALEQVPEEHRKATEQHVLVAFLRRKT